ncbi:hypothetical protein BC832DRAFT_568658 [Gaertneriomyces semiglobifer]|nr:hypothetical protein BC832DRAFT_568658 [Gaertneriomyces semiglobifer]
MTTEKPISKHDEDILNLVFNPDSEYAIDDSPADDDQASCSANVPEIPFTTLSQLRLLESTAVRQASSNPSDLPAAYTTLTEAITLCPHYASAYNNRAQVLRLQGKLPEAQQDLETAIQYGQGDAKVLKQAYTQRAVLRKQIGDVQGYEADMAMGARYGNELAKKVVRNNPYAKMCNAMVMEAMKKLQPPA